MSIFEKVKSELTLAMKNEDSVARSALRSLLSRIQITGNETDEFVISSAKSLIKQSQEEIEALSGRVTLPDGTIKVFEVVGKEQEILKVQQEIKVLSQFLPVYASEEKIAEILNQNLDQLKAAKNIGAAMGISVKIMKAYTVESGVAVDGSVLRKVVESLFV